MLTLQKTLDSSWDVARQSLRDDLVTIETVLNRKWGQTFGNAGILPVAAGGTGFGSYSIGDLLYASAATTLSKLSVGASGKILRSNGALPVWSTFTIPDTYAQGDLLYASAANALTALAKNPTATRYLSNTGGSNNPAWAQVDVSNGVTGMAALTKVDDTNVTVTLGGTPASALIRAVSLTLGWTGTLSVARGGIGIGTLASNGVLYGNGTSAVQALAVNATATRKFLLQLSSAAPTWDTITAADIPGSALTRTNDTNVTLTLGGSPTTALLAATSLTLGWTGTLAATRGGTGVSSLGDLTKVNDTNVTMTLGGTPTGSLITSVSMTLGWTGTLSAARGGTGVGALGDLTRTNDTNVTLTLGGTPTGALIQAVSITAGWTGTLAVARGGIGVGTLTGVVFGNGTSAFSAVALPADATKYLDGTGAFSVPAGGGGTTAYAAGTTSVTTGHFLVMSKHLILTSTQRMTLAGTAHLALIT